MHGGSQAQVNGIINGALLGYHEALPHQPTVVSGYLVPGRSGWPSAIPHTTYGDSVAATAAGIEAVVRTKVEVGPPNFHGVVTKQVLAGDITTGVEALSCIWSGQGPARHRKFFNFDKCAAALRVDFSVDKVLGIYEARRR